MQALVCHALSEDLSGVGLASLETPIPGPGEALVAVRAASVNFPDILMCQGRYQFRPEPPFVPGLDFAGEILAFGPDTEVPKLGAAVMGGARLGAFAEFCVAPVAGLDPVPEGWSFAEAAAFPAAALTAYVALVRRARIEAGETLLVHGAASGVGLACVQLGLRLGARVIACASTDEKRAFLKAQGVAEALPARGFREAVLALTGGRGADVVFDPVGGDVFEESCRVTAFDGRLLVVGFTSGRIASVQANIPLIKGFSVVGVRAGEYGRRFPQRGAENRAAILALAQGGGLRPHIHAVLPLQDGVAGMRMLQTRAVMGKVALEPRGP
jgi:NADPH2:quinone reductase